MLLGLTGQGGAAAAVAAFGLVLEAVQYFACAAHQ
jgi:hypothetical protein